MASSLLPDLSPADLKLLRVFRTVVECGGFTPAQAELNVSASTISMQMAALEARFGMRLCQRGRVGFRLTDKGTKVYAACLSVFAALDNFRADVGALSGRLVGDLNIAIMDNTITNPDARLHEAIGRFATRDNAVHINLHVAEPATLERGLLDGKFHVGIAAYYHHVPGLAYRLLFREHQALYCGAKHDLFERAPSEVTLDEVCAWRYVARGYIGRLHMAPIEGLTAAATAYDMEAIAFLILSGRYIGHLPAHYAARWVNQGQMRPILPERFDYHSRFEVATRKGAPPIRVVEVFLEDLDQVYAETDASHRGSGADVDV